MKNIAHECNRVGPGGLRVESPSGKSCRNDSVRNNLMYTSKFNADMGTIPFGQFHLKLTQFQFFQFQFRFFPTFCLLLFTMNRYSE